MQSPSSPFPRPGADLGSLEIAVSADANDRYWAGAAIDHDVRRRGLLFPPMIVNFTMLLVQQTVRDGVLHTWGRVRSRAAAPAGQTVGITGRVLDRFEKRERDYLTVATEVRDEGQAVLWEAEIELAASRRRPGASADGGPERLSEYPEPVGASRRSRRLRLDADLLRLYSRAGNFHSDDGAARAMGLPGMTAMGMQTIGPGYGLAVETWGEDVIARGELETRFFGLVLEDDTVEVVVHQAADQASFSVRNVTKDLTTAAGRFALP